LSSRGFVVHLVSARYVMCGVGLTGIDVATALVVVSEANADLSRFFSDKHFASWLGSVSRHQGHRRQSHERQNQVPRHSYGRLVAANKWAGLICVTRLSERSSVCRN